MRQHLAAVAQATGEAPAELEATPIPEGAGLVAQTFFDLHATRSSNGFGLDPITHLELWAWQRMHHVRLTPWEIETLLLMDRAALTALQSEPNPE